MYIYAIVNGMCIYVIGAVMYRYASGKDMHMYVIGNDMYIYGDGYGHGDTYGGYDGGNGNMWWWPGRESGIMRSLKVPCKYSKHSQLAHVWMGSFVLTRGHDSEQFHSFHNDPTSFRC